VLYLALSIYHNTSRLSPNNRQMKRISFLILSLLFFKCTFAQVDSNKTMIIDGVERHYTFHLPLSFHSFKKVPVIFAFQPSGTSLKQTIKLYNLNDLADEKHFIVIYPEAQNKKWNIPGMSGEGEDSTGGDDIHFISSLIDTFTQKYKSDSIRFFAAGMSRGGTFALYLADRLPHRIDGIALVCASVPRTFASHLSFAHPVPVLLINGTMDPLINFNGGKGKTNTVGEENEDEEMLPTEVLIDNLTKLDFCDVNPVVTDMPRNKNGGNECSAVETVYNCKSKIDFIAIINGGHTWPGEPSSVSNMTSGKVCRDFNAEDVIYEFFRKINTTKK
jgi:polyhydroxybutyrate depolymerase